jgi:hypothetical protein
MILSITALKKVILGIITFGVMTLNITTLCKISQHNGT